MNVQGVSPCGVASGFLSPAHAKQIVTVSLCVQDMLSRRIAACAPYETSQRDKLMVAVKRCDRFLAQANFTDAALATLKDDVRRILSSSASDATDDRRMRSQAGPSKPAVGRSSSLPAVRPRSGPRDATNRPFVSSSHRTAAADKIANIATITAR